MLKQAWTFSPLIEWTARDFANAVPVAEKYRLTKLCPRNPVFHWARATIGGDCRRDALQEFAPSLQPSARDKWLRDAHLPDSGDNQQLVRWLAKLCGVPKTQCVHRLRRVGAKQNNCDPRSAADSSRIAGRTAGGEVARAGTAVDHGAVRNRFVHALRTRPLRCRHLQDCSRRRGCS